MKSKQDVMDRLLSKANLRSTGRTGEDILKLIASPHLGKVVEEIEAELNDSPAVVTMDDIELLLISRLGVMMTGVNDVLDIDPSSRYARGCKSALETCMELVENLPVYTIKELEL